MAGTVSMEAQRLTASAASVESREVQALLVVLSVTAGCVDIISFVGLNGLFTANITGNLVILAAHFFKRRIPDRANAVGSGFHCDCQLDQSA